MFKTKKTDYQALRNIMSLLRKRLLNKSLLDYIVEKIRYAEQDDYSTIIINGNSLTIRNKEFNSTFELTISETEIFAQLFNFTTNHFERKHIQFTGNSIGVKEEESSCYNSNTTGLPMSAERTSKVSLYQDYELVCIKEMHSLTEAALDNNFTVTTVTETYINSEKAAVQKSITAGDTVYSDELGVKYFYIDSYQAPRFCSIGDNPTTFIIGETEIPEADYEAFMKKFEETEGKKLKKDIQK